MFNFTHRGAMNKNKMPYINYLKLLYIQLLYIF